MIVSKYPRSENGVKKRKWLVFLSVLAAASLSTLTVAYACDEPGDDTSSGDDSSGDDSGDPPTSDTPDSNTPAPAADNKGGNVVCTYNTLYSTISGTHQTLTTLRWTTTLASATNHTPINKTKPVIVSSKVVAVKVGTHSARTQHTTARCLPASGVATAVKQTG